MVGRIGERNQQRHVMLDAELAAWYDGIEDGLKSRELRRTLRLGLKADAENGEE